MATIRIHVVGGDGIEIGNINKYIIIYII